MVNLNCNSIYYILIMKIDFYRYRYGRDVFTSCRNDVFEFAIQGGFIPPVRLVELHGNGIASKTNWVKNLRSRLNATPSLNVRQRHLHQPFKVLLESSVIEAGIGDPGLLDLVF